MATHIQHAHWVDELAHFQKFGDLFGDEPTSALSCVLELVLEGDQVFLIFLGMFASVLVHRSGIGDYESAGGVSQVLLHLQILEQAPVVKILLHVLYNNVDGLTALALHCCVMIIIEAMAEEQLKTDNLILPNSPLVLAWSLFFSLSILIYFGSAVFEIGFQTRANQIFNSAPQTAGVFLFCIFDTLVFINIGVIQKGKLVRDRHNNIVNYLHSALCITDSLVLLVLLVRFVLGLANKSESVSIALSVLDLFVALKFLNIRKYDQILKFYYF